MTVLNPPGFLQNAGATHTAEQFRNWIGNLITGTQGSGSLLPLSGVHPALGFELVVTQAGSPNMTVLVRSGLAAIVGSEGSKQGAYSVLNDADVTVNITAAHASLGRIDSIVFKVEDSAYSGASDTSSIVSVDGTPSGSPAAPTLPSNCIELAQITVGAGVTSIVTGNITDRRRFLAATGGIIKCTASTRPGSPYDGMIIYQTDTDSLFGWEGTTWVEIYGDALPTAQAETTSAGTASSGTTDTRDTVLGNYQFTAVANTRYEVVYVGGMSTSVASTLVISRIRDGGASTPVNTDTIIQSHQVDMRTSGGSGQQSFMMSRVMTFSAGTHTLGLFTQRSVGTGDNTPVSPGGGIRQLYVKRLGPV